ncbi:MAG: hypothetical protein ACP5OO_05265 [Chloroflexia bacterium]
MTSSRRWIVLVVGFFVLVGLAALLWIPLRATPVQQGEIDYERFATLKGRVNELRQQGYDVSSLERIVADVEYWIAQGKVFEANLRINDLEADLNDPRNWGALPTPPEVVLPPAPSAAPIPEAGATILFQEDFASPSALDVWQNLSLPPDPGNTAHWEVRQNALYLNMGAGSMQMVGMMNLVGDNWEDYVYSVDIYPLGNQEIGAVVRYQDGNFYRFRFLSWEHTRGPTRFLERVEKGQTTVLVAAEGPGYQYQRWYNVQIAVSGTRIAVYLDGQPVLQAEDDRLGRGQVGVFALSLGDVYFDNVRVSTVR